MVAVSYHDSVNYLQARIYPVASPFDRAEWYALLEEDSNKPLLAVAEDQTGFAALPLAYKGDTLIPFANWYAFTWRALANQSEPEISALSAIARSLKSRTHRVTMEPVPNEDGSADILARAFRQTGWSVKSVQCDHNHVLEVAGRSFAEYWAQRPGRMRTTLKRKAKKVEVAVLETFDADFWSQYEAIYAESWKPEEGDPVMLRSFAEAESAAGRLRLGIAKHDGTAVAAQFWTVEDGTAYIHKLAHSEAHRELSAGTTLSAALFERVIDTDKVSLIDFGTGNDRYKSDWMEQLRPRYRIDCLDASQPKAWPAMAKRVLAGFRPSLASARPRS